MMFTWWGEWVELRLRFVLKSKDYWLTGSRFMNSRGRLSKEGTILICLLNSLRIRQLEVEPSSWEGLKDIMETMGNLIQQTQSVFNPNIENYKPSNHKWWSHYNYFYLWSLRFATIQRISNSNSISWSSSIDRFDKTQMNDGTSINLLIVIFRFVFFLLNIFSLLLFFYLFYFIVKTLKK